MNLTSRILQYMPMELLIELDKICKDVTISDNNMKVDKMVEALDRYDVNYSELGPGTNRFAIFIEGYVFKIAMDRLGVKDNWAEFSLTQELQPFVIKVYECNGLIIVTEYVTVISKDEFMKRKDEIRRILSTIADRYLLGDVGTVSKNFMNWGYRDTGELTILDFAYIYRIKGEEMICDGKNKAGDVCQSFLNYDENFHNLVCPTCGKKYIFTDIRAKIDPDYEKSEIDYIKQVAEVVTEPRTSIVKTNIVGTQVHTTINEIYGKGEDETMAKHKFTNTSISEDELEDLYADALNSFDTTPDVVVEDVFEEEPVDDTPKFDYDSIVTEDFDPDIDDDEDDSDEFNDIYDISEEKDINEIVEEQTNAAIKEAEEIEKDAFENVRECSEVQFEATDDIKASAFAELTMEQKESIEVKEDNTTVITEEVTSRIEVTLPEKDTVDTVEETAEETTENEDDSNKKEDWPIEGVHIVPAGDSVSVSDAKCDSTVTYVEETVVVSEEETTECNEEPKEPAPVSSFIKVTLPETDNNSSDEDKRNELRDMISAEEDYGDEYDDLYEDNVRANNAIKYGRKGKRYE